MDGGIVETRNILNSQGEIIGELSLPEGASEDFWTEKLSVYLDPPSKSAKETIELSIKDGVKFGNLMLTEIKYDNIVSGITAEQTAEMIEANTQLIVMLISGQLKPSLDYFIAIVPNEVMTETRLSKYINLLKVHLRIS